MEKDTFVKFTSRLGNSFVAPSRWEATDGGDTFSLASPDGRAVIHAVTYTAAGSGPLDEFAETVAEGLLPDGAIGWETSAWSAVDVGGHPARVRDLVPVPESDQQWRLYVLPAGRYYHALIVNAAADVMPLNRGFYDEVVRSFEGVRE